MATNSFVSLDVPSSPGTGVPADISGLAPNPSLIVEGPDSSTGRIVIEVSEDGIHFAPATSTFPIHNPPEKNIKAVAAKARVRRMDGGGPAFVALGAITTSANLFAALSKVAVDTSGMGPFKSVVITGTYVKPVIVEASNDGVNYDVVLTLTTRGSDLLFLTGTWSTMRLRDDSDVPESIAVGSGFEDGAAGGSGVTQLIAGTNVSLNPTSGVGVVTVNATGGGAAAEHLQENLTLNDTPLTATTIVKIHGDGSFDIAKADNISNSLGTVGVLINDVAAGVTPVVTDGKQTVNMEPGLSPAPTASETIWLSPNVAGRGTNLKPSVNPQRAIKLGTIKDASRYTIDGTVVADINIGENQPAQTIVPGDAGVSVSTVNDNVNETITIKQLVMAAWPVDVLAVFAIDSTRPDDSGAGFAIPADGTSGAYQTASVAAGAVAKKTVAGFLAIFPKFGGGRLVEIQLNGVGTYDADDLNDALDGVTGYQKITVRGTGTVASAGTTKFDGTQLDTSILGGTTGTGMNAPGYKSNFWFNAFGGHSQKVGGADPAWVAPAGLPLGIRIRFDKSTATAAIRNECRQVCRVPDHDETVVQTAFSAAPDAPDLFYTEQPGVVLTGDFDIEATVTQEIIFAGLRWTGNITNRSGRPNMVFCTVDGSAGVFTSLDGLTTSQTYNHPIYGDVTPGGGLLVNGTVDITNGVLALEGLVATGQLQITSPTAGTMKFGAGNAANNWVFNEVYGSTTNIDQPFPNKLSNIGTDHTELAGTPNTFGAGPLASLVLNGCYVRIGECLFQNCGNRPALKLFGRGWVGFVGSVNAEATDGTASYGIDLTAATQTEVEVESIPPDLLGSQGQILLPGEVSTALWGDIQLQDLWDRSGNHLFYAQANLGTFRVSPNLIMSFWNTDGVIPPGRFGLTMTFGTATQCQASDLSRIDDLSNLLGLAEETPILHTFCYIRPLSGISYAILDAPGGNVGQAVYVSETQGLCTVNPPNKRIFLGTIVASGGGTTVQVAWQGVQNIPATVEEWFIQQLNYRWLNVSWDYDYDTFNDLAVASRWNVVGALATSADLPMGNLHGPGGGATYDIDKNTIKTVVNAAETLWAVGGYAKVGVTVNGTDQRRFMVRDDGGTNFAAVGVDAAISSVKYSFIISKNGATKTALSTVSINDGVPHKLLIVKTPTQILGRIDNEPLVVITSDLPTDCPVGNLWEIVEGVTTSDTFDIGAAFIATGVL